MSPSPILRFLRRSALAALLASPTVHAGGFINGVWKEFPSDTLWSNGGNWDSGDIADGPGSTADFNTYDSTADQFIDLDSARTIGNLVFGDLDAATTPAGWTLTDNANPANILILDAPTPTITVNALGTANLPLTLSPKSAVISASLDGSAGLTKAGAGRLKLTAANTYTGGTVVDGGKLSFLADNRLGAVPGVFETANITIRNGGVLELTALIDADNQGGGTYIINANRGILLGSGVQFLQRNHRGQTFRIDGVISGPGSLVLSTAAAGDQGGGSGWAFQGANTHTGDTYLGWPSGQQKAPNTNVNNTLALQNSTLNYVNYFGFSENLGRQNEVLLPTNAVLGGLAGGVNAGQVKTLNVPGGLKVGNNNKSTTFSGKLLGGGSLEKIGNGTLTLTRNDHTYSGLTTISGGTLALGASGSINNSSGVVLNPGGTLDTSAVVGFFIPSGKPYTFHIDGTSSGSSGSILAGNLDIDTTNLTIVEDVAADDAAYVLATYTSLTGITNIFASVTGLPAGYTINYAYNSGTQIALVSGGGGSPYDTWATTNGLTGAPASSTDPAFDADPNGNGTDNGLEWILGGDPLGAIPSAQPTATADASGLTLTFTREEDSIGQATLTIEYGTDVQAWPGSVTIGATSSGPDGNGVVVTVNDVPSPDEVTVFIPASNAPGGALYARAMATMP